MSIWVSCVVVTLCGVATGGAGGAKAWTSMVMMALSQLVNAGSSQASKVKLVSPVKPPAGVKVTSALRGEAGVGGVETEPWPAGGWAVIWNSRSPKLSGACALRVMSMGVSKFTS